MEDMSKGSVVAIVIGIIIGVLLVAAIFVRITFIDFVDNHQFGYRFDTISGEITPIDKKGYIWSAPFITKIYTIETRPFQVVIGSNTSSNTVHDVINTRVLNAKLVQFDPKGYKEFISLHGTGNYSADGLYPIMMNYAFDPSQKKYSFLKILKQLENEQEFVVSDTLAKKN